jgi:hypothetical protein
MKKQYQTVIIIISSLSATIMFCIIAVLQEEFIIT